MKSNTLVAAIVMGLLGGAIAGGIITAVFSGTDSSAPRICSFSRNAVLSNSTVGKAGTQRLQQIVSDVGGRLNAENTKLQSDIQAFQKKSDSMKKGERKKKQAALANRQRVYNAKVQNVNARVRYTRNEVTQGINQKIDPLLTAAYKKHGCSVLLNQNAVLAGTGYTNLTGEVTAALDKAVTKINFTLLQLPKKSGSAVPDKGN